MGSHHVGLTNTFTRIRDAVAALPVDSAVIDVRRLFYAPTAPAISRR